MFILSIIVLRVCWITVIIINIKTLRLITNNNSLNADRYYLSISYSIFSSVLS